MQRRDARQGPDGKPLRRSWVLGPAITKERGTRHVKSHVVYEAQVSMTLSGIDNRTYTAYGVMDTYWESKSPHSVEAHHELWKQSGLWDPMSVRTRDVEAPIWDARIYFLSVWSANLDRIVREWDMVTGTMEYQVAQR